jgi:uncharacterized protein (TIGR02270 family)
MNQESAIRWDIVEEHLDEAAFLYGQWEAALRSPLYTLQEIADGPEERLLAHLDGLVLGGPRVAKRLLLPALESDEPGFVFAATFALVDGGRPEDFDAVLAALEKGEPEQRAAIRRALGVVPCPDLGQRLAAVALRVRALQTDLLEVLGYLRVDPGLRLEPLANSKDPAKEALAIRLARMLPERLDPTAIERGFTSNIPEVRAAALETGLILGRRNAFAACEATVKEKGSSFAAAALLLGVSGDEKWIPPLVSALEDDELAHGAAFALGFTGRVSAADALLAAMRTDELGPVAADGFSAITGLAMQKQFSRASTPWNPQDEQREQDEHEVYGPESDLAPPEPDAIARWWKDARQKLDPVQRWIRGRPWSVRASIGELETGPAHRRAGLTLDLAIRSHGKNQVAWDSIAGRQRRDLTEARGSDGTPVRQAGTNAR